MNSSLAIILIVMAISVSECIGQSCLKQFRLDTRKTYLYFTAIAFYGLVCALLVMSYKYKGMGVINILWSGLSVLLIASTGVLFFHETLTLLDKVGMLFVIVGMGCILYEN
jgi:multidrug transporter EmrE-like cation transporter